MLRYERSLLNILSEGCEAQFSKLKMADPIVTNSVLPIINTVVHSSMLEEYVSLRISDSLLSILLGPVTFDKASRQWSSATPRSSS